MCTSSVTQQGMELRQSLSAELHDMHGFTGWSIDEPLCTTRHRNFDLVYLALYA